MYNRGPRKREKERYREHTWRNNSWKLPQRGKGKRHLGSGAQSVPNKMNPKRSTPRHIMIKQAKIKNKKTILNSKRKAACFIQGNSHKTISWLFSRNFAGQMRVAQYIQSNERKNVQPRIFYSARLLFRFEREIKSFTDKQKLEEFSATKLALQEMLKELL